MAPCLSPSSLPVCNTVSFSFSSCHGFFPDLVSNLVGCSDEDLINRSATRSSEALQERGRETCLGGEKFGRKEVDELVVAELYTPPRGREGRETLAELKKKGLRRNVCKCIKVPNAAIGVIIYLLCVVFVQIFVCVCICEDGWGTVNYDSKSNSWNEGSGAFTEQSS